MGKIICDICGTSYPDTAEQCPICGCTREAAAQMLGEDLLLEDGLEEEKGKGGRFSSRRRKEIFDFDEVNTKPREPEEDEGSFSEGEDEEEEEESRPNTFAVVLLTVLIAGLLIAAGFLFVKFIMPNMGDKDPENVLPQQTGEQTAPTGQAGSIPCETLVLSSGNKAMLTQPGGLFLLHVNAIPSDTTDVITFTSADESVATVSQDGRIEAVSEGETVVTITCGTKTIECQVIVQYVQETVPPTAGETAAPAEGTAPVAAETTPVTTAPPDVTLKLKRTDIKLGVGYEFQLLLDCALEQNQVEWSSEHPHIVSVDENGVVKALKWGTTSVTAKYGDQEVSCIVRCG